MIIETLILGAYETNCYVLRSTDTSTECLVVDPGLEAEPLLEFLTDRKLSPVAVLLTHGHIDHIAGLELLHTNFPDIKVYIHRFDAKMLTDPYANLSIMSGLSFSTEAGDMSLEEGDIIELVGLKLEVIHTPGHTPGGISLYSPDDGVAFVGDTLFAGSIGRTDFPGGDMEQLLCSVKEKLVEGERTLFARKINTEFKGNPCVQGQIQIGIGHYFKTKVTNIRAKIKREGPIDGIGRIYGDSHHVIDHAGSNETACAADTGQGNYPMIIQEAH